MEERMNPEAVGKDASRREAAVDALRRDDGGRGLRALFETPRKRDLSPRDADLLARRKEGEGHRRRTSRRESGKKQRKAQAPVHSHKCATAQAPHIRSGPYSLGVVIAAEEADVARGMVLSDVIVRSSSSKREVRLPIAIKTELKDGGGATEIVHSFRNLDLPYEDYEFRATVTSASGGVRPLVISLKIRKKYSFEWRVPLWDMLMSA